MVNSRTFPCGVLSEDEVTQVLPETIVLSSKEGAWRGIEVVQRRHTVSDHDFPPLSCHTIGINLGHPLNAVERIDGRVYEGCLSRGRVNVLPACLPSHWRWRERGEADVLHLYITPALLRDTAAEAGNINPDQIEIVNHLAVPDPQLEYIGLALMQELVTGCLGGRLFGESLATALAVQLLQKYSATKPVIPEFKGGLSKYKLRRVIEYINENLEHDVALTTLAGVVDMNVHHFAKMFKQNMGIAPHQYIIERRIERAKQLLTNTELSIIEVCHAVGFDNQSHFTKLFRRYTATTPKMYRDAF